MIAVKEEVREELLEIEHELAAGGGDEYRARLVDDAVVIIPGQALDRDQTAAAMDASPGWDEFRITDARVLELAPGAATLTYRFDGRRGEGEAYSALMSSTYSLTGAGWKLVLHQQTPIEPATSAP